MKLKAGSKGHYDAGPNMTPLVDIVMVILIFLMLTGTFAVGEHFLTSNLPLSRKGGGGEASPNVPLDEPLEIRVDSTSAEEWIAQAGGRQVRNGALLKAILTQMREALNANKTPTDKIQVVINPGRNTKYKHLVEVYEAALDAKYTKVAFSTAH
ncbi:MAG: biopolymer transporter ExbD [Planctomycetota bacterium]|nr:biopolymer transporter ExbD [Planctomycetota bacterium]